jgi:hypothetical protein
LAFSYLVSAVTAPVRTIEAAAFVAAVFVYVSILWNLDRQFRRKLGLAFSCHRCAGPSFATISEELRELNEDCAHFIFTAEQSGNVLFREKPITLVYGHVGCRYPGGIRGPVWKLRKRAFALVPNTELEWVKTIPSVFRHATSGYRYSIFWVSLEAFVKADSGHPHRGP